MIEALLFGIVLGMIPVTLSGLFVTAYLQYRRGDQLNLYIYLPIQAFHAPSEGRIKVCALAKDRWNAPYHWLIII
jgi:cytochrome b6-f complex subunit 5